jgi:hypothetical protein
MVLIMRNEGHKHERYHPPTTYCITTGMIMRIEEYTGNLRNIIHLQHQAQGGLIFTTHGRLYRQVAMSAANQHVRVGLQVIKDPPPYPPPRTAWNHSYTDGHVSYSPAPNMVTCTPNMVTCTPNMVTCTFTI